MQLDRNGYYGFVFILMQVVCPYREPLLHYRKKYARKQENTKTQKQRIKNMRENKKTYTARVKSMRENENKYNKSSKKRNIRTITSGRTA